MKKTVSIVLEEETIRAIKVECARREWSLGEFYEEAMRGIIRRLEELKRKDEGIRLREMPDQLHCTSIWVDSELANRVDEAKSVGLVKRAVYYTAIHDYLEKI